jgi:hypothetical protein
MTTTAAVSEDLLGLELTERPHQQVQKPKPTSHAPEQADHKSVLELVPSVGGRVHRAAILSLIALVQGSWLLGLGYGALRLIS